MQDLLLELGRKVVEVGVSRGAGDHDILTLTLDQFLDQFLWLRRSRGDLPDAVAQSHTELDHVPRFLQVVPSRKLVEPAAVELRASEPLGLGCRDALDHRAIDQVKLLLL